MKKPLIIVLLVSLIVSLGLHLWTALQHAEAQKQLEMHQEKALEELEKAELAKMEAEKQMALAENYREELEKFTKLTNDLNSELKHKNEEMRKLLNDCLGK